MSSQTKAGKTLPSHLSVCNQDGRHGQLHRLAVAEHLLPSVLLLSLLDIQWFVHIARAEVRSLCNRIRVLRDRRKMQTDRYDGMSVDLGPLLEPKLNESVSQHSQQEAPAGCLVPCTETLCRSRDIESLFSKFPWASDADILLFLEGWEMGRRSAHDSACNKNMEPQQAYLLALRLAGLES